MNHQPSNYIFVYMDDLFINLTGWWFLATPLKNMSSSIGMMTATQY